MVCFPCKTLQPIFAIDLETEDEDKEDELQLISKDMKKWCVQ